MWITTALNVLVYPCYAAARAVLGRAGAGAPPPLGGHAAVPWPHLLKLACVLYVAYASANYLYAVALTKARRSARHKPALASTWCKSGSTTIFSVG